MAWHEEILTFSTQISIFKKIVYRTSPFGLFLLSDDLLSMEAFFIIPVHARQRKKVVPYEVA